MLLLSLTVLCLIRAIGQTTSTEVVGTVADASGAVVPNAKVTLLRVGTGETRSTVTDASGNYSFPLIEIGQYTVSVEAPGFKTETKTGINVELQQKARVNFQLQVGTASERIEVEAVGVELKTDDAALGATIDHKRVTELPTLNRNFASLLVLTPGVQFGTRMGMNAGSTAGSFYPGATQVSANGQRDANQRVTLDGVIASEPLVNTVYLNPSIDAIEEVKVQTGSYSAEYGMNNGANVQVALKSGTNAFHGTIYEFLRNDAADARDYFLNFQLPAGTPLQSKNRLRRNQFGTWLSGPVLLPHYKGKDKTFWSFNFEGTRQTQESVAQIVLVSAGVPQRRFFRFADTFDSRRQTGAIAGDHLRSRDRDSDSGQHPSAEPDQQGRPEPGEQVCAAAAVHSRRHSGCQLHYHGAVHPGSATSISPGSTTSSRPNDRIFGRFATQIGDFIAEQRSIPTSPYPAHSGLQCRLPIPAHFQSATVLNEFRVGFNKVNHDQVSARSNTELRCGFARHRPVPRGCGQQSQVHAARGGHPANLRHHRR